jgi:RHS repeat-associated protein
VQRIDYEPFGKVLNPPVGPGPRKTFIDQEVDKETGLNSFGVRMFDGNHSRSGDPLWEKYESETPYHYGANNVISLSDPSGFTLYYFGADADRAIDEMAKAVGLELQRDAKTGQVFAVGNTNQKPSDAALKLLAAINSSNITVNVIVTAKREAQSQDGTYQPIRGGLFDGSAIDGNGNVQAFQFANYSQMEAYHQVGGVSVGESFLHETNEAYIGAEMFPGQQYSSANFAAAHAATQMIDPNKDQVKPLDDPRKDGFLYIGFQGPNGKVIFSKIDPATNRAYAP